MGNKQYKNIQGGILLRILFSSMLLIFISGYPPAYANPLKPAGCENNGIPVNIALRKPVKVSSADNTPGWMPEYLVDGLTYPSGLAKKGWSSVPGFTGNMRGRNEWIEIDLGDVYRINCVKIYPRNDTGHTGDGFPVDFKIQISEDEVVWADIVTQTNYEKPGNSAQNFNFDPVNARYVRVVGTKLREVDKYTLMQFSEIEVYHVPAIDTLSAKIEITADSSYILYVNGTLAGTGNIQTPVQPVNVSLNPGTNIIAVEANCTRERGGLIGQITIDGKLFFTTNNMWKMNSSGSVRWNTIEFDDSRWDYAVDYGPYGIFPWNYDLSGFSRNMLARWIGTTDREYKGKLFFRLTIRVDSKTGAISAKYRSPGTSPQPEINPTPRTAVLPAAPLPLWSLAKNGTPGFVIVKSQTADPVENFAATELQSYLGKMIGAKPAIVTAIDNSKVNLLLGTPGSGKDMSDALKDNGLIITESSHGYDGYIIKTVTYKENKIILLCGYKPRAVLFASYHLLETLGCRFLGPKTVPSNEIIPFLPDLSVANLNDTQIPVTKFRMMSNGSYYASETGTLERMADWGAKNGYNSILLTLRIKDREGNVYHPWEPYDPAPLTKRGFEIMMAGHNWAGFIDNASSAWYTDEANVKQFLENVKAYTIGHPEAAAIGAWQMDGPRGRIRIDNNGQNWRFTEWNLYLMNRIAEMYRSNGIDKRVMWMAYVEGNRPPLFITPDSLLDLYYYHQWQNYQAPLDSETGRKQVDWILNDYYRRPQNSDHASEPIPDSLLAQQPVIANWSNYLSNINFQGDKVLVDHIAAGIGMALKYPALSFTNLGPVYSLEADRRYERELGFNGYTNCFGHSDYSDSLFPASPDPYLHRRMAETLWNDLANRDLLDSDFYISYYGAKYATKVMRFFDRIYFEILADKRDYQSVKNCMGDLYSTITDLKNTMLKDKDVTNEQKERIRIVYNWYNRRVIPYKLQYYNMGEISSGLVY